MFGFIALVSGRVLATLRQLLSPPAEQGDRYASQETAPSRGHMYHCEHRWRRSSGKARHPRLLSKPLWRRAVVAGGSRRAADGAKSLLEGSGGLSGMRRLGSRWAGLRRTKKGCVGEPGPGGCWGLGFGQTVSVLRRSPCLAGGFSPGEPWSQDGFISLLSDRRFIVFCPFRPRKAGFLLEMDTVPSGDC